MSSCGLQPHCAELPGTLRVECSGKACIPAKRVEHPRFALRGCCSIASRMHARGRILPREFHCQIPEERLEQATTAGALLGESVCRNFLRRIHREYGERSRRSDSQSIMAAVLVRARRQRRATIAGRQRIAPSTELKLSLRVLPLIDGAQASQDLKRILKPIRRTAQR
jgi:hypothetical protein